MTTEATITLRRGDSRDIVCHVVDDEDASVDITNAVIKFSMKYDADDENDDAVVFKKSYDTSEIEITDGEDGRVTVKLDAPDTDDLDPGCTELTWDLEVTRPGTPTRTSTGTIAVTASSGTVVGSGTAFTSAKVGDMLVPSGAGAANQKRCTITAIASATSLTTDYTGWSTESAITFSIVKGDVKTAGTGPVVIESDVTR